MELNKKWYITAAKSHDEEGTIQDFIYPLLEALGWNLVTDLKTEVNRIDLVLYSENRPYIGIEAKSLSYGPLEETKRGVGFNRERLLKNCREIQRALGFFCLFQKFFRVRYMLVHTFRLISARAKVPQFLSSMSSFP